jgi:hypothetical protein
LLLYSSKPSLGVYQLADHLLQANKFSGTIITAPSVPGLHYLRNPHQEITKTILTKKQENVVCYQVSTSLPQGPGCVLPMIRSAMVIGRLAQSLELTSSGSDRTRRQPPASRLGVWDLAISGLVVRIGKRIDSQFNGREIAPAAVR